ncbi:MAG: glutathione peroxidase [Bacteroidales bacterium]
MKNISFFCIVTAVWCAIVCNSFAQQIPLDNNKEASNPRITQNIEDLSKSIYCFSVKDIDGKLISLNNYKGKVLLIVNVASKCGLTPQYRGLEDLYRKYKDKGLEILAFPCNQFLNQEPAENEEIERFCKNNYDVTFSLFEKIEVNGSNESPLYTFLKMKAPFKGYPSNAKEFGERIDAIHKQTGSNFNEGNDIKWNFSKFLVSKDGKTIERYEPMVEPKDLEQKIERLLKQ